MAAWSSALRTILSALLVMGLSACAMSSRTVVPEVAEHQVWQPLTLDFEGPLASETGPTNPFTDYRLTVTFAQGERTITVPGFFAADGNAAESGADSGNVWRVRFAPDFIGEWTYSAQLYTGPGLAINEAAPSQLVSSWTGSFNVAPASSDDPQFYSEGFVRQDGRYFRFSGSGKVWLKGGANSPENLLGFADFDGTYRIGTNARDGEADGGAQLHSFAPHIRDWREGDPTWRDGKGKGLVGAINYLSDQGMNVAYFLVFNVEGDGKDVWPWRDPEDRTRFDVSKMAQWEIVFAHMQRRGIALHIVLQETENELLLDDGDTGPERKLFLRELIARFGHHPALFWNIGEENGPVHWRPEGQTDDQRKAMARYIAETDPYRHPILLHTHSEAADKDAIIAPQLGNADIGGLSFQVSQRETVNAEIRKWHALSRKAGQVWPITMDEIGKWQVGARADTDDPRHDSLRRHALWGALLAGAAGVEWYFGAEQNGNDLTTEDWRSRAELWRQTRIALDFFEEHLRYWDMQPCEGDAYCLEVPGETYALYLGGDVPAPEGGSIADGDYRLRLFDPVSGQFDASEAEIDVKDGAVPNALYRNPDRPDRVALLMAVDR